MARFIVVEGIDGSGTSTQAQRIADALKGLGGPASVTFEPTDGPVGSLLRQWLQGKIPSLGSNEADRRLFARLFAADRHHHLLEPKNGIQACLGDGRDVVCARYVPSSLAYEGADDQEYELVSQLNSDFPLPDLTIYLDCPVDVALRRIHSRDRLLEVFETDSELTRVRLGYERVFADYAGRFLRVDATRPPQDITNEILGALSQEAP